MKFIISIFVCLVVLVPNLTFAQVAPGGLVSCEGEFCTACHVVDLVNDVVKWLIGVLMVVFALIVAYAGFGLVTSGGNPEAKTAAKQKLTNAFVGLVIVLSAWLLVDTLMRAILVGGSGEIQGRLWTEITCGGQTAVDDPVHNTDGGTGSGGTSEEAQKELDAINAKCGVSDKTQPATAPTTGLCSADTGASIVPVVVPSLDGEGPWTWSCGYDNCSTLPENNTDPDSSGNGCGPAAELEYAASRPDEADLCLNNVTATWNVDDPDHGTYFSWNCTISYTCSLFFDESADIPLACGEAADTPADAYPSTNKCEGPSGTYVTTVDIYGIDDGYYDWKCTLEDDSQTRDCKVKKNPVNTCALGYELGGGARLESLPSSLNSLCYIGTYAEIEANPDPGSKYSWACQNGGGGIAFCEATNEAIDGGPGDDIDPRDCGQSDCQ